MLPFVLTKIFSLKKKSLANDFISYLKEDYIANTTSGWKAKNFPSFYYLPNTN